MRKILHIDMDAFYASVEQRDDPALRGRPVVVAWEQARSVVCAASYEARAFGVRSAMPAMRARRLCPSAVFIPPNFEKYRTASRQIGEIFRRHTELVEFLSLDEAYLDVTRELTGIPTATAAAEKIRSEVRAETGLTASAGVAPNKFIAKIASDWRKPDGLFVVKPHQVDEFLMPLAVTKIPGVGRATAAALEKLGILIIADLRRAGEQRLTESFGSFGRRLHELAFGIDERPVVPDRASKSYSYETTFATDLAIEQVSSELLRDMPRFFDRARAKGRAGRTVTVKLKTSDFRIATRRTTLSTPPESVEELVPVVSSLLGRFDFPPDTRYRLAGFGFSNFGPDEAPRSPLFDSTSPDLRAPARGADEEESS